MNNCSTPVLSPVLDCVLCYVLYMLQKLLDYFYVGELKIEQQTVMPVWMTAAYLELPEVVSMCNEFCQQSVSNQFSTDEGKVRTMFDIM